MSKFFRAKIEVKILREEFDTLQHKFNLLIKFLEDRTILNEEETVELYNEDWKNTMNALSRASKNK